MTQQPQVPQPEGQEPQAQQPQGQPAPQQPAPQQPAPQQGGSGFDASGFQQDLTTKTISVNNAWILTGMGGLLFISVFLPWVTVSIPFVASESWNVFGEPFSTGWLILLCALAISAAGALTALRVIPFWGVLVAVGAALLQLILTFVAMGPASDARAFYGDGANVSHGFGLWLSLLGTLAVIGWAVFTYLQDKVDYVSSGPLFPQQNNNHQQPPQGPAA